MYSEVAIRALEHRIRELEVRNAQLQNIASDQADELAKLRKERQAWTGSEER